MLAKKGDAVQRTILWARISVPDANTNITSVCSWALKAANQSSAKLDGSFSMVGSGSVWRQPYMKVMMTLSNGNIGPLWWESTGHRLIPLTKTNDTELWCFLWSALEQTVEQANETLVTRDAIALIMKSLLCTDETEYNKTCRSGKKWYFHPGIIYTEPGQLNWGLGTLRFHTQAPVRSCHISNFPHFDHVCSWLGDFPNDSSFSFFLVWWPMHAYIING